MQSEMFSLKFTETFLVRGLLLQLRDRPPSGTEESLSESFSDSSRQIFPYVYPIIPTLGRELGTEYCNGSIDGSFK